MKLKKMQLIKGAAFAALVVLLSLPFTIRGAAHIIREEPWHPVAAAYLRSLFYANLKPINWELIAREYEDPIGEPGYESKTIYDLLAVLPKTDNVDQVESIRKAIADKDPRALFSSSTSAFSQYIRYHLDRAESKLGEPGAALKDVLEARRLYRALESFIDQADPDAYDQMGRSWLSLTNSVGNAGVLDIGGVAPNEESFNSASSYITKYLKSNYEIGDLSDRPEFLPLPKNKSGVNNDVNIAAWLPPGSNLNDQSPLPRLVLNFESRGLDERDLFLVAYGDMLFDSTEILGEPARSFGVACSTCHNRSDINQSFIIPGVSHRAGSVDVDGHLFNPIFNDHRNDSLDIPSLRGLRFTAPYGRDGRFASLRDFVRNVIVNEFRGPEPTPFMLDALVTYMLEFDWLPSVYLRPDGTLADKASDSAKRGEVIFNTEFESMGGRACSTCHIPSANFIDGLRHDIGSAEPSSPGARDSFFDTPTLVNIKYTAPYFHDGSLESLEDVVDWFNTNFSLGLNKKQKADLTSYLDAVGTGDEPFEVFDNENTPFLLDWAELSTFISTLDTLIPAEDEYHTKLLIETVSSDLRADAIGLQDLGQAPMVYELSDKLDEILDAVEANDWKESARLWMEYKSIEEKYGSQFK
ncbi:MAG: cytochrome c peroxidase [Deltaproteobacteria bacterium]